MEKSINYIELEENSTQIIELTLSKDDLRELIEYYRNKENRTSSDRFMIAQMEVALENQFNPTAE